MLKKVIVAAVAWLCLAQINAQKCMVQFNMQNTNRHVSGEVHAECPGGLHSSPWGNWGVSSNVGNKTNGHQFQGFHLSSRRYQWNSCTRPPFEAPNCSYYNYAGCTEQHTVTGPNVYGGGYLYYGATCTWYDEFDDEWYGGCRDRHNNVYGPNNNFMTLYELDPFGPDEFVTTLYFDDEQVGAPLNCPDAWGCDPSYGPWVSSHVNGIASAQIRVAMVGGWYIDSTYCDE